MILNDTDLAALIRAPLPLVQAPEGPEWVIEHLLNPASVDIRVGGDVMSEAEETGQFYEHKGLAFGKRINFPPSTFALCSIIECINVPNGYAVELRLKSSIARRGWDHAMAFWVDPGWQGILTMEIRNATRWQHLVLEIGQRFAQIIVHRMTGPAEKPYKGKYQGATGVEQDKTHMLAAKVADFVAAADDPLFPTQIHSDPLSRL